MPARSRSGAGRSAAGPTDGHYSESYGRSLLASAGDGAAAGASTLSTLRRATEDGRSAATEDGSPTAALRLYRLQFRRPFRDAGDDWNGFPGALPLANFRCPSGTGGLLIRIICGFA